MSSLVEAIAKQAQSTFSRTLTDETFAENIAKLIRSVARIRSTDLKVNKDALRTIASDNDGKRPAPVTYIEVKFDFCLITAPLSPKYKMVDRFLGYDAPW